MSAHSGRSGAVYVGTKKAIALSEWNFNINTDTERLTVMQSGGWKLSMFKLSDFSGTATGKWDLEDIVNTGQQDIQNYILLGGLNSTATPLTLNLYTDYANTLYYTGKVVVKNLRVTCEANGVVGVEFSFDGTGKAEYKTA